MSVIQEMNGLFETMGQSVTFPHISGILKKHAEKYGIGFSDLLINQLEKGVDKSEASALAESLFRQAQAFYGKGDYRSVHAFLELERTLRLFLSDAAGEMRLLNLEALTCIGEDNIREALEICDEAVSLADKHSIPGAKARLLFNMGSFLETCDSEQCSEYLKEALTISRDVGNGPGVAYCCDSLSRHCLKNGDAESACRYSKEAVANSVEGHGPSGRALFLYNLALAQRDTGKYSEALVHMEEAEKLFPLAIVEDKCIWAAMTTGKASILLAMNRVSQAEKLLAIVSGSVDNCKTDVKLLYYSALYGVKNRREHYREALEAFEKVVEFRRKDQETKLKALVKITVEERHLFSRKREKEILSSKNKELTESNARLRQAISEAETLSGLLPVCSNCGKVRTDEGYWEKLADYLAKNSGTTFSESLCEDCKQAVNRHTP